MADLRHRFSGSIGGYLWNVLVPVAQIAVFALVFGVLMHFGADPEAPGPKGPFKFVVILCSGLLPWTAFAETLVRGSGSLAGSAGYLKKLAIPEQIFVAKEAMTGLLSALLTMAIFAVFAAGVGWWPHPAWVQALALLALFLVFAYGLGLILACLNIFFRDIQPLIGVIMLLWMWLTPVVWQESQFKTSPQVAQLLQFNPAYHFIKGFHDSLMGKMWLSAELWGICIALAVGVNLLAWPILRRLRGEIRDVI